MLTGSFLTSFNASYASSSFNASSTSSLTGKETTFCMGDDALPRDPYDYELSNSHCRAVVDSNCPKPCSFQNDAN